MVMANERDAVSNFLNEVMEPQDIFTEEKPEEIVEEREEKPIRFDKDPKVQKYIEKQVEKALKDRPSAEQSFKKDLEEDIKLPKSLINLIGNDTPEKQQALKDFADTLQSLKGEARQEFLNDMKDQETKKNEADTKAQEELDNYFEEIEETYDVDLTSNSSSAKQLKTQFVEYIRKIAPKDASGEVSAFPDLIASFEEFQEKGKRPSNNRAKELASRGMTRSSDTTTGIPQGKSWKDVERYFTKLKESN